jgi:hypothetical protein
VGGGGGGGGAAAAAAAAAPAGGGAAGGNDGGEVQFLPLKAKAMRKRGHEPEAVFNIVKELLQPTDDYTHQCVKCGEKFRCIKNKHGYFKNDKAKAHLTSKHKELLASQQHQQAAEKKRRAAASNKQKAIMLNFAQPAASASAALLKSNVVVSLCQFYVFSKQHISKQTIECPYLRAAMEAAFQAGRGKVDALPTLSKKVLFEWVRSELTTARWHLQRYIKELFNASCGTRFAQGQHDNVTLKNGSTFIASALQFMDLEGDLNEMLCMGLFKLDGKKAKDLAAALDWQCRFMTGFSYTDIAFATISDRAALAVATRVNHDQWSCDMHDDSHVAESAVGDLTRKRGGADQNPFPEAQALMGKVHSAAKYFRYESRRHALRQAARDVPGGVADILPQLRTSTTRVAARHREIQSCLRLWKAITVCVSSLSLAAALVFDGGRFRTCSTCLAWCVVRLAACVCCLAISATL